MITTTATTTAEAAAPAGPTTGATSLSPLQHAFALHLLHRAWTHLLQNHSTAGWPTDWEAMKELEEAEKRVQAAGQYGVTALSPLVQLAYALHNWREGCLPSNWEQDFVVKDS